MQGVSIYKDGRFNDTFLLFNDMISLRLLLLVARCQCLSPALGIFLNSEGVSFVCFLNAVLKADLELKLDSWKVDEPENSAPDKTL